MTVCIGAICNKNEDMVYVTDTQMSYPGAGSAEGVIKLTSFHGWAFGYAGDAAHILGIVDLLEKRQQNTVFRDVVDVQTALATTYAEYVATYCARKVLLPYDMDMPTFRKEGRQIFGDEIFRDLNDQITIARRECDAEFLVGGWEEEIRNPVTGKQAGLFSYSNFDGVRSLALTSFGAIGCGAPLALSVFIAHEFNRFWSFENALYLACAAKFASEKEPGVGKTTFVTYVQGKTSGACYLHEVDIAPIRAAWEQSGKPRLPAMAGSAVMAALEKSKRAADDAVKQSTSQTSELAQ